MTDAPDASLESFLDAATAPLKIDPDLALEVRQELRTHLEESAADFRRAGHTDAEAIALAKGVMGDEKNLADQLWKANRRRIRFRAAALWSARLLLPPATVALIILLAYNAAVSWALAYHTLGNSQFWIVPPRHREIAEGYRAAILANAPADVRRLFEMEDLGTATQVPMARELAMNHPADPAFFAFFALLDSQQQIVHETGDGTNRKKTVDEQAFNRVMSTLADGERREPDNALYPLIAASTLFEVSSREKLDESLTLHRAGHSPKSGDEWSRIEVLDEKRYAQALDAMHRAAAKPYLHAYIGEILRRKLSALPVHRLADVWLRAEEEIRMLLPHVSFLHRAAWNTAVAATEAATAGRRGDALRLIRDIRIVAGAAAADAAHPIEMNIASADATLANEAEARVAAALHDSAAADAAWKRHDEHQADYRRAFDTRVSMDAMDEKARAGVLYSNLLNYWTRSGGQVDAAPMRRAEYAAADQIGVATTSAAALVLAILYAGSGLVASLRRPGDERPPRLVISGRGVAKVLALGAVVPVIIYLIYARLNFLSGRSYGLNFQMSRIALEYVALALIVTTLLSTMIRRAVRARAAELGVPLPPAKSPPRPLSQTLVAAAAVAVALACLITIFAALLSDVIGEWLPRKSTPVVVVGLLAACWGFIAVAGIALRNRLSERSLRSHFVAMTARSAFPAMAMAALALSLLGFPLRWAEHHDVAKAARQHKSALFLNDAESPEYHELRDKLVAQRQAILGQSS